MRSQADKQKYSDFSNVKHTSHVSAFHPQAVDDDRVLGRGGRKGEGRREGGKLSYGE